MNLFIHSAASIIPEVAPDKPADKLLCKEPDYTGIIPPMQIRRMSKAVRIGIAASKQCLGQVGIQTPDAIITGTGLGCLQDTEVFLRKMIVHEEQMLTPTSFIQSTHNTVAGQIALVTGSMGYNLTVSQSGHSFENAAIAAQLYLTENPGHNVLLGGVDELTETSLMLLHRGGVYSAEKIAAGDLIARQRAGTLAGEGASFFVISDKKSDAVLRISGLKMFNDLGDDTLKEIASIVDTIGRTDLVLSGRNGDARTEAFYDQIELLVPSEDIEYFKTSTGDYPTVISRALHVAVERQAKRTLIINHWCNTASAWVLEQIS